MFLTVLIPGDQYPCMKIDVYLQLLIDKLKSLWDVGLKDTYDVASKTYFDMRAALLWTVNDFPAYGMLFAWSTHGKLSFPIYMEDTKAFTLKYSGKPTFFYCHRRFLDESHPFRENKSKFRKGKIELDSPPPTRNGEEIWSRVRNYMKIVDLYTIIDDKPERPEGYGETHNWNRRNIFWDL